MEQLRDGGGKIHDGSPGALFARLNIRPDAQVEAAWHVIPGAIARIGYVEPAQRR
jgi:hypothetical protein